MSNDSIKTVVFVSNYFNHHQKPFSDAMYKRLGNGYVFIETEKMTDERKNMGWEMEKIPSYVVSCDSLRSSADHYVDLINKADFVIIGSAPERLVWLRKKRGKPLLRYSERPLKEGFEPLKFFPRMVKWNMKNPRTKPIYMLCASAYTAGDYAKFGLFKNRCFKWGYFTELKKYEDIETMISNKKTGSILWAARLVELKHPETCIEVAKRLRTEGYEFTLNIIGSGPLEEKLKTMIAHEELNDHVFMCGAMKPDQVREYMERAEIFMFTSDRREGWGAVLNESMNSACAVVASDVIGSVPFLIKDRENGMVYSDGDIDELYSNIKWLLDNKSERKVIARNAYDTMKNEWNAENAADKLISLMLSISNGAKDPDIFETGVCSRAK